MEKNPFPKRSAELTQMFARWRKDPWPKPSALQEALALSPMPTAEQVAAKQEWDAEGGAIKPPIVAGPKLPL